MYPASALLYRYSSYTQAHRRRLGVISEPQLCQATLDGDMCDMNTTEVQHACSELQSNTSMGSYWDQCSKCKDAMRSSGYEDTSKGSTSPELNHCFAW
eukprot:COSAG02_NODE_10205_length_1995_cov_52.975645_3_plen_98_part_00